MAHSQETGWQCGSNKVVWRAVRATNRRPEVITKQKKRSLSGYKGSKIEIPSTVHLTSQQIYSCHLLSFSSCCLCQLDKSTALDTDTYCEAQHYLNLATLA